MNFTAMANLQTNKCDNFAISVGTCGDNEVGRIARELGTSIDHVTKNSRWMEGESVWKRQVEGRKG